MFLGVGGAGLLLPATGLSLPAASLRLAALLRWVLPTPSLHQGNAILCVTMPATPGMLVGCRYTIVVYWRFRYQKPELLAFVAPGREVA